MPRTELVPLVALTGAGVSAESGVPTFRGSGGLWEEHPVEDLATPEAFARDPGLVWRFYAWRRRLVAGCRPNMTHTTLAEIERHVPDFTLITQNVDGLHQASGSRNVIELHGSLWRLRCSRCPRRWKDDRLHSGEAPPRCPECGHLARPDVVWFGEALDPAVLSAAIRAAERSRVMLILGTSAVVQPAAQLPLIAREAGARLVEINLEGTPLTRIVDESLRGPASVELGRWWNEVGRRI